MTLTHIALPLPVKIGVLALQGAFIEHIHVFQTLPNVTAVEVRTAAELEGVDGLVIPGGESTTMALVAERSGLMEPLRRYVEDKRPVWGTCAGMILLANKALHTKRGGQSLIGGLDATVDRNHFGTQLQSFEADLHVDALGEAPFHAMFIRAPVLTEVGEGVRVLCELSSGLDKGPGKEGTREIVAVTQGECMLATAFHPELTHDHRWHELFVRMVRDRKAKGHRNA